MQLAERSGKDRAQIARWERDIIVPSLETLRELLHVCGFDLELTLVPYAADHRQDARCRRRSSGRRRSGCRRCCGLAALMAGDKFDPYGLLVALKHKRISYIVVGGLGRVIHGSDELTDGLDIVPSTREENLRRLGLALDELNARRPDGQAPDLERDLASEPLLALQTDAGELEVVPEPAGTRGYDDLRRRARLEPLGRGLRPSVASLDDHARMLAALAREQDRQPLRTLQRLLELDHGISRGIEL